MISALCLLQIAAVGQVPDLPKSHSAPTVEGNWLGALDTQPVKLRLALKVSKAPDGALAAKLDSLDQGAMDLPVSTIRQSGRAVAFELKAIGGSYDGTLTANGSELVGEWKQNAAVLPLTFRRVDKPIILTRPQEPKKPYLYEEQEVVYENKAGGAKLAGTLTLPPGNGPFAAALLITGSGQQDRDESVMGHRPFLVLADHLTRKGIAVLRVDDRGVGGSTGEVKTATSEDFAGDVLAGVEFLKSRGSKIDPHRIGLIGHSEGGLIAAVAARAEDVSFIVMMAGSGVKGEELMGAQAVAISKAAGASPAAIAGNRAIQDQVNAIIKSETDPKVRESRLRELRDKLKAEMKDFAVVLDAQFQMAASPWFRFFLMFDPATALRKVTCPVLAVNGELDLQVLPDQNLPAIARALEAGGNRDYETVKLPRLNHLFQTSETGSPSEYAKIEETMAPLALDTISEWIVRHTRRP